MTIQMKASCTEQHCIVILFLVCLLACLFVLYVHLVIIYISLTVLFVPPKTFQRDTTPEGSYGDLQSRHKEVEEFKIIKFIKKRFSLRLSSVTAHESIGLHQLIAVMSLKGYMRTDNL